MNVKSLWRRRATRHVIGWALIVSAVVGMPLGEAKAQPRVVGVPYSVLTLLVSALVVYAHYALLTHLLERRRRVGLYLLGLALLLPVGTALFYYVSKLAGLSFVQVQAGGPLKPGVSMAYRIGQAAGNILFVLLLSTGVRYVRRGIVSFYEIQRLRALQLQTELSLLKAQVNQHFLFNTLNNLYGLSLAAPAQLPEALLQLAELMRYQLDSSRQQLVTVGAEADYLANHVGLEKLRLRQNTEVEFYLDLPHPERPLASGLLLLPLVENCFKHAVGPGGPNRIRIELVQTDATLTLRTDNTVPPHFRPAPSGLGLPNLRARLAQFYPAPHHQLKIEADAARYVAELTLQV